MLETFLLDWEPPSGPHLPIGTRCFISYVLDLILMMALPRAKRPSLAGTLETFFLDWEPPSALQPCPYSQ